MNKLAAKSSVDFDVCSVAEAGEQLVPRQEPDRQLYRWGTGAGRCLVLAQLCAFRRKL